MEHRCRRVLVAAAVLLVPALVAGCSGDPYESYCSRVRDQQEALTRAIGDGSPDSLITALPILQQLAERAPDDVTDEWQQLTTSIVGLRDALADAGVDPASYDRKKPPTGVSADQRTQIDAAAARLGSLETQQAAAGLDQESRDVCQTPLTL